MFSTRFKIYTLQTLLSLQEKPGPSTIRALYSVLGGGGGNNRIIISGPGGNRNYSDSCSTRNTAKAKCIVRLYAKLHQRILLAGSCFLGLPGS